ncbi:DUF4142 domain-containing protein [Niabella yanshanensis]|uniref:DUF4142 domain-containing protein n=1 Tax=Niabella yanshanensis TaxID=577386 RepID=A0ABZ0W6E4_9BACT|nr:DUF4142 domain-containing protein [Niabella yanshanensis]WQD38514.1 DUF4142 domain-containing protein [Niabella yanshanensis]
MLHIAYYRGINPADLNQNRFNSTYIYMMVEDPKKAIQLHEPEVQAGSNANVKGYASDKLKIIRHHKMMADSLANALFPVR